MDNYLSLKGRGLTKRKKFISQGEIGYGWVTHPSLDRFFPLYWGGFQPELFNYLIINYSVNFY